MRKTIALLSLTAAAAVPGAGVVSQALAAPSPTPAASAATTYGAPVKLMGASGGEPSIASGPAGDVYVTGPQGIPSGANMSLGVGFWASHDGGKTFGNAQIIGSQAGGGDSDVLFTKGSIFITDLEAAASQICKSTDFGKTFSGVGPAPDPNHCTTVNAGQVGPSNDRQWLTASPDGSAVYLTYHEFVSAQPIAFRSDNGGADGFANPCGPLITDPAIEANVPTDITGGTLVSKPVTDAAGNLYILFSSTTQQQNAAAASNGQPSGTFSQLYLAVSKDKCQNFTDYKVYDGETAYGANKVQFGDIFNDLAIDGAGNLYSIGAGYVNTDSKTANLYLLSSSDHGKTWTKPRQISAPGSAYMMPSAVGGPLAGQLAIGYFRTINGVTDPNDQKGQWTYSASESTNALDATPTFTTSEPLGGADYHNGEICNLGILCGTIPGGPRDRSLADFTSAVIDGNGCAIFAFAGNPGGTAGKNTKSDNYVVRQTSNCLPTTAPVSNVSATSAGNGTTPAGNGNTTTTDQGNGSTTTTGNGGTTTTAAASQPTTTTASSQPTTTTHPRPRATSKAKPVHRRTSKTHKHPKKDKHPKKGKHPRKTKRHAPRHAAR